MRVFIIHFFNKYNASSFIYFFKKVKDNIFDSNVDKQCVWTSYMEHKMNVKKSINLLVILAQFWFLSLLFFTFVAKIQNLNIFYNFSLRSKSVKKPNYIRNSNIVSVLPVMSNPVILIRFPYWSLLLSYLLVV